MQAGTLQALLGFNKRTHCCQSTGIYAQGQEIHTHLYTHTDTHKCTRLHLDSPHLLIFSIKNLVTAATKAFYFSCAGKAFFKLSQNLKYLTPT